MTRLSVYIVGAASVLLGLSASAADPPSKASAKKQTGAKTSVTGVAKNPAPNSSSESNTNGDAKINDRLVLDATVVTGNRELPKVMYIVPWKKADLGNLPGQPFNTLLDEALAPLDRDVFRREVQYYEVISGKDQAGADQATPKTDSK